MPELESQARQSVGKLLTSNEDQLYTELGSRLQVVRINASVSSSFDPQLPPRETLGSADDLKLIGQRFFQRLQTQAYALLCGTDPEDAGDRQKLQAAFNISIETAAVAFAATLVSTLGLMPMVAGVVAAIVVKRFFRAAYGATCDVWKTKLDEQV